MDRRAFCTRIAGVFGALTVAPAAMGAGQPVALPGGRHVVTVRVRSTWETFEYAPWRYLSSPVDVPTREALRKAVNSVG